MKKIIFLLFAVLILSACSEHKDDGVETWGFNGDVEKPTFTPSIKVLSYVGKSVSCVCHSQITDGKIFFYNDSTHELSSQEELLTDL